MRTYHDLIIVIIVLTLAATAGILFFAGFDMNNRGMAVPDAPENSNEIGMPDDGDMMEDAMPAGTMPSGMADEMVAAESEVKEFVMTSYYDPAAKRPFFSLAEMEVRKGDRVRIRVTNTMGMHDFTLDEYGIKMDTPLNEEVVVEFVADKAGDFVYYCSKPGHRAAGQWGTLRVL